MANEMHHLIIGNDEFEVVDRKSRLKSISITDYSEYVVNGDWTTALQRAINENETVTVNINIDVYGTVKIPDGKTIILDGIMVKKPSDAQNTDPIFFLNGSFSSLMGCGASSTVRSYVASPDGVVKIGQINNTTATKTIVYSQVSNMTIRGAANADNNIGVHLCGTFGSSPTYYASYFHVLTNLYIHTFAMGIVFNNAANANIVNNIQFWNCGYSRTTGAFCFIRTQGEYSTQRIPLENVISNCFHHDSPNASTIYIGTTIGYNRMDNICCEQGGSDSHAIVVDENELVSSMRNIIKYTDNSNAGIIISDEFKLKNTLESQNHYRNNNITADNELRSNGDFYIHDHLLWNNRKQAFFIENKEGLYENTLYEVASISPYTGTRKQSYILTLTAATSSASLQALNRVKKAEYQVNFNGSGAPTITELDGSFGTLNCVISDENKITLKLPNNGTNTHNTNCRILIELFGYTPSNPLIVNDAYFEITN